MIGKDLLNFVDNISLRAVYAAAQKHTISSAPEPSHKEDADDLEYLLDEGGILEKGLSWMRMEMKRWTASKSVEKCLNDPGEPSLHLY